MLLCHQGRCFLFTTMTFVLKGISQQGKEAKGTVSRVVGVVRGLSAIDNLSVATSPINGLSIRPLRSLGFVLLDLFPAHGATLLRCFQALLELRFRPMSNIQDVSEPSLVQNQDDNFHLSQSLSGAEH